MARFERTGAGPAPGAAPGRVGRRAQPADLALAALAPPLTGAGQDQAHEAVEVAGRPDRGPRAHRPAAFRAEHERGPESVDRPHRRLRPLADGLAFVHRKALEEAAGGFRLEDIADERRLARPGDARDSGELALGDIDAHPTQVVGGGVADADRVGRAGAAARRPPTRELQPGSGRGWTTVEEAAVVGSAAGSEVDDPVGPGDVVGLVLHDHHSAAGPGQAVEGGDEAGQVGRVEAGGRLVEHDEVARPGPGQLAGEAHALRLAARQRGRRLAQRQVAQPHLDESVHHPPHRRVGREQLPGPVDGEGEGVGDRQPDRSGAKAVLEGFGAVAQALAGLAFDPRRREVRQANLDRAHALGPVEGEGRRRNPRGRREQGPDAVEHLGVSGRVRPRVVAEGRLVDGEGAPDLAVECFAPDGLDPRRGGEDDVAHEGGLAGARRPGDGGEASDGQPAVEPGEVAGRRSRDGEEGGRAG